MKMLLFLSAILAFLGGVEILVNAKSAIHEIEAFILFLISAVFISGAGIVNAVNLLQKEIATVKKQASTDLPNNQKMLERVKLPPLIPDYIRRHLKVPMVILSLGFLGMAIWQASMVILLIALGFVGIGLWANYAA